MRIYGNRWSIECFFKASKSFLKLGSEFQSRSYGAMVSHTTIVFTRYIILEWLRRNQNDEKTYGELFFMYCEDIQNMDLTNAKAAITMISINTNIEMHIINGFFFDFFAGSFIFEFIDAPHPLQNFESSMRNTFLFYL